MLCAMPPATSLSQYALLTSTLGYALITVPARPSRASSLEITSRNKLLSALHATLVSISALYILHDHHVWPVAAAAPDLITTRDERANALTALEAGYLAHDTVALLVGASKQGGMGQIDPVMMTHHVGIGTALAILQWYIRKGKERGVLIIVMFLLMNAS